MRQGRPSCSLACFLSLSQLTVQTLHSHVQVQHLVEDRQANGVIMAYGISGAGKTFTIEGTKAQPGVVPQALSLLFEVGS